jgi:hypothetical protein
VMPGFQPSFTPCKSFNIFENIRSTQSQEKGKKKVSVKIEKFENSNYFPMHKKKVSRQSISSEESIDDTFKLSRTHHHFQSGFRLSGNMNFTCAPAMVPFKTPKAKKEPQQVHKLDISVAKNLKKQLQEKPKYKKKETKMSRTTKSIKSNT